MTSTDTHSDVLAHVAGVPVEEALVAAPALLAGVTVIAGYVRATAARRRPPEGVSRRIRRREGRRRGAPRSPQTGSG
jgi:hypothetical protein